MTKSFRSDDIDQALLMPPSLQDWLPENHLARFVADLAVSLDLSAIYRFYEQRDGRGQAAYHPVMMVRLLLYGYCIGVTSSRKIEKRTYEDVAFRYLSAGEHPDHDTLNEFRKQHLEALAGLFVQALQLCQKAGLVKLGHVAVDGTKLQANASKHKAMSYGRMNEAEEKLKAEVAALLARAEAVDTAEDEKERQGQSEELPKELARRESRLKKIQEAKAELEAEARQKAEQEKANAEARIAARHEQEQQTGKKVRGPEPRIPDPNEAVPDAKAQRNFTDSESRIMPDGANKGSFLQAYNAQIAVDSQAQIIVAADITQDCNDKQQLASILEQVQMNTGTKPVAASADAGYWSTEQISDKRVDGVDLHIATGRDKHGASPECSPETTRVNALEQMKQKLRNDAGRTVYKMRKAIVEPVFGQTKECRRFRRFSFRGAVKVRAEWKLVCLTHNLLKLFRSGKGFEILAAV
ncbi:MAG TPA: IS1182 family transposase [Terriglobales bacterium]|jgi:transposase|nr:IS1182 family transposase [Terriglobales bacterium]